MNDAQLINQNSGDVEYYTDPKIIEAARLCMGSIDFDPASSSAANKIVKAAGWYGYDGDQFTDGLFQKWQFNVWLNHPFGRQEPACVEGCTKHLENPKHRHHSIVWHGNKKWIDKLLREFKNRDCDQACCITYASTSEGWFQPLMDFPQCFLSPRTNYYLPDGKIKKGVTKGSVVTYLGGRADRFHDAFKSFGVIKVRYANT